MTAAIKNGEGMIFTLPRPKRHNDVIEYAYTQTEDCFFEQGFVLSDGTFADGKRAEEVARASGQKEGPLIHHHLGGLSSDDLW